MGLYRSYSSAIPKNVFKDKSSIFHKSRSLLPMADQVLHPFYSPSYNEEFMACMKEVQPCLLDGKRIIPCLITSTADKQARLSNCAIQFDTVRGVNKWLERFNEVRSRRNFALIDSKAAGSLIKPSKLDKNEMPQLNKLLDLFGVQRGREINPKTLDTIVDQLVTSNGSSLFCEDIYSYLLHHHVNSIEKITAITESIKSHLQSNIDQFNVVEILVLQILISLKKNNLATDDTFIESFADLLTLVAYRFHLTSCEPEFKPAVNEALFEYYISVGKINESKNVLRILISNGFLPNERSTVKYLQLLDSTLGFEKADTNLLKKFAYISDIHPVIEHSKTSDVFNHLIKYCRHYNEITSLCDIINVKKNAKEIFEGCLETLITQIANLNTSNTDRSRYLCSLYLKILPFYNNKLPEKFCKHFLMKLAQMNNFSMIATILKTQKTNISMKTLISMFPRNHKNEKSRVMDHSQANFETIAKGKFVSNFFLKNYPKLDKASRSRLLFFLDSPSLFSKALELENNSFSQSKSDILDKFMVYAFTNHSLQNFEKGRWSTILDMVHVKDALNKAGINVETSRNQSVSEL